MSNIYIQEPPTDGKVLLVTSVGDIDIELWSREAPKACRNFVQLCLEGYYNGTIFHRVVKDFIVQGGDPTGTGEGGESIYGAPFKDEIHSRLRFVRRGLVAMANAGPHDNGSQFFFTMGSTPELQNKHTIFGKVGGDTIYNMIRLQEVDVDSNDRPTYPLKIKNTKVLSNPFDDIVPRQKTKESEENDSKSKSKSKGTKNYSLLSFGEEAEEDEEEVSMAVKDMKGRSKSSHDLTDDPKLSSQPAVSSDRKKRKIDDDDSEESDEESNKSIKESIQKKLKSSSELGVKGKHSIDLGEPDEGAEKMSRKEQLRKEAKQLRKELKGSTEKVDSTASKTESRKDKEPVNDVVASYLKEKQKYQDLKKQQNKKGSSRENATMELLSKFQNKLRSAKVIGGEYEEEEEDDNEGEEDSGDMSWMRHTLKFDTEESKRRVIDANVQELDRYDYIDPRNPLNQRRREASKQAMKARK
ncbi:spliceosome-associated protein CWC27 homolog [Ylistrum balloti]|uniref:spliceosome-associated protein CWC27 homolog n=1 Tax=Ylistrum balloti TaxID=509963 RepID=UPI002905EDEA|nr:spliceosome-associated protein CWC27 homolog [Ylistrum balloti]